MFILKYFILRFLLQIPFYYTFELSVTGEQENQQFVSDCLLSSHFAALCYCQFSLYLFPQSIIWYTNITTLELPPLIPNS